MSALDPDLRALLVCPKCKGELADAPQALSCPACRLDYPILDGIPVLVAGVRHADPQN